MSSRLETILKTVFEAGAADASNENRGKTIAAAIRDITSNDPLKELIEAVKTVPRGSIHLTHSFKADEWELNIKMHDKHKDVTEAQDVDPYRLVRNLTEKVKNKSFWKNAE